MTQRQNLYSKVTDINLNRAICSLFEVHAGESGVQRIVTPLEYPGSKDQIVIRVRPSKNGDGFFIDENSDASLYASMSGGDIESESVVRWADEISLYSPVQFTAEEKLVVFANKEELIAPYIFRVAEAAQQLFAIATSRTTRQINDFKERVRQVIEEIAASKNMPWHTDIELPISGGLKADHMLGEDYPLIIITATSAARLLEAEVIFLQYQAQQKKGYILALAEDQEVVGKKQYERAAYFTNKTVIFSQEALRQLIFQEAVSTIH
ncbi:hypothetical protein [Nitrosomonas sp. Nm34]|uniref:hypothetical protein n=1 Tax=Nitrosomonas sp. Nm34 TaxID=1881055 RepID=UPI0008E1EB8A|nr:hypothetical protein [Nitrosomonas sp. Nm34]SFJ06868.1 hypothetical protein SAMN05428978_10956 [Nitrosomonas sp. Nm34]